MTIALIGLCFALLALIHFDRQDLLGFIEDERRKAREEREVLFKRLEVMERSHREEIAQLHQSRVEETANLLQRIQAPEQAVVEHTAGTAQPDPPPANLENDEEMFRIREERLRGLGALSG